MLYMGLNDCRYKPSCVLRGCSRVQPDAGPSAVHTVIWCSKCQSAASEAMVPLQCIALCLTVRPMGMSLVRITQPC